MRIRLAPSLVLIACATLALPARGADRDFVPLLAGSDLSRFDLVGIGLETVTLRDGVLRLRGNRKGYVATKESFKNYVLKFEWMYEPPYESIADVRHNGDSGVLLHIQGPPQVWPRGTEVQVWHQPFGSFSTLGGATFHPVKDTGPRADFYKAAGQWNQHEITCRDGTIAVKVNGVAIAAGKDANPDHGRIGWMSEEGPIRFRHLMVKRLDD